MPTGLRHRIDDVVAQLVCQRLELCARELPQISGAVYRIKHTGSCTVQFNSAESTCR